MEAWQSLVSELCDPNLQSIEVNGYVVTNKATDAVLLPWHQHGLPAGRVEQRFALIEEMDGLFTSCQQLIIHVEKSRQATLEMLRYAWPRLPAGAQLYLCGPNELGIKSTAKQAELITAVPAEVAINKRKARVLRFVKPARSTTTATPTTATTPTADCPSVHWQQVPFSAGSAQQLWTRYGIFSADALDDATALMQELIADEEPGSQIIDMASGCGHLGLFALDQWPESQCVFLEADARAVSALQRNMKALSCAERASARWWSAGTPCDDIQADLILMNPPAHSGKQQSFVAAHSMFQQAYDCLTENGRLYIIANRQLPYEHELRRLSSDLEILVEEGPFKILLVRKHRE